MTGANHTCLHWLFDWPVFSSHWLALPLFIRFSSLNILHRLTLLLLIRTLPLPLWCRSNCEHLFLTNCRSLVVAFTVCLSRPSIIEFSFCHQPSPCLHKRCENNSTSSRILCTTKQPSKYYLSTRVTLPSLNLFIYIFPFTEVTGKRYSRKMWSTQRSMWRILRPPWLTQRRRFQDPFSAGPQILQLQRRRRKLKNFLVLVLAIASMKLRNYCLHPRMTLYLGMRLRVWP